MTARPYNAPYRRPSAGQSQFHVTDYLRVLHKRRWTASLVVVVVFAWGAYGTLKKTPIYEAMASVQIERDARRASTLNTVLDDSDAYNEIDFYQTEYKILQSRALAWRAVQALHLDAPTPGTQVPAVQAPPRLSWSDSAMGWLKTTIGAPKQIAPPAPDETTAQAALIGSFLGGLQVVPIRQTHLVELRYDSADPAFAASAANAVAEQYRVQSQQQRFSASKETSTWLEKELNDQKAKVEASDLALQQYKETHDAVALDTSGGVGAGGNIVLQKMTEMQAALNKASADRIAKEGLYQQVKNAQGNEDALESLPAVASNEFVQKLKGTLDDEISQRTKLSAMYGPKMQQMIDINNLISANEARLGAEVRKAVQSVVNDYTAAQATEQQLSKELESAKTETLSLSRKGLEYAILQRESQSNRQLYDDLVQHSKETGVTGDYKGSNIQIVDRAEVPRAPIYPQTSHDLFMAFMEGLVLAVGLAFGLEYLDNRIRTPDEIKQVLGLTFLGLVPEVPDLKPDEEQILLLNRRVPPSFGEAIRAIRTSIIFSSAEDGAKTVVITSTAPSEGKTVVSSNLAAALAQASQRTLLIDADMRRPRVHEVFGTPQEPGLSHVLVGTSELHETIRPTAVPNLFLLPAGHLPPNPVELLASMRYRELMSNLRHQFDWVIIDAPPVMAVTDAAVVANSATGVVFVIGAEMTTKRNALAAIEQLSSAKAHFIGAVLNKVDIKNHAFYYSPYYRKDYTRTYEQAR